MTTGGVSYSGACSHRLYLGAIGAQDSRSFYSPRQVGSLVLPCFLTPVQTLKTEEVCGQ